MEDLNKRFIDELRDNPKFKDITYENGVVSFQGKSTNVSKLYLYDFVKNENSPLVRYLYELDADDVFRIIDLHTKRIHDQYNEHDEDKSDIIISPNQYIKYINKTEISDEDNKKIQDFETLVYQCYKYYDYLLDDKKIFLSKYRRKINEIELKELEFDLTDADKYARDKYYSITDTVRGYINEKIRKKEKDNNKYELSAGYANAFIVILSTIATGIIAGTILYFTLL